jgi:hypothetical protein
MYLKPERVGALLRDFAGLDVPRVRVILTAMDAPGGAPLAFRPGSEHVDRWLKKRGEPMRSSIPAGREDEVLSAAGLKHLRTITPREFRTDGSPMDLVGENIIVAER